jgi:hypothetical protein
MKAQIVDKATFQLAIDNSSNFMFKLDFHTSYERD